MDEDKFLTMHPAGKKGVRIDRPIYDLARHTILGCLEKGDRTHNELVECVEERLYVRIEGSIRWYMGSVKLDLESRGVIERYKDRPYHRYHMKE